MLGVPMFRKVPFLGTLYLEKTLYCRISPEIFVCVNESGRRYLCIDLSQKGLYGQWLVGRVDLPHLFRVLQDKMPVYAAIRHCRIKGIITGVAGRYRFTAHIPEEVWSSSDRFLQLYDFDCGVQDYCRMFKESG